MIPHPNNFCSNGFPDWLEVNLTPNCNAKCAWCVEKKGWHPSYQASWKEIADAALATGRQNIILLGGEPTLHPDIGNIIHRLRAGDRRPWVTTNGSKLTPKWIQDNMAGVWGVNISVHHYNLAKNLDITGILLREEVLRSSITTLLSMRAIVRMNCNCIKGHIDSVDELRQYIQWSKSLGATKVRFAELKHSDDSFVDLPSILDHKYGVNDNPFEDGCSSDAVIDGLPVNFRQMCGMQTRLRPCPIRPDIKTHPVLYYNGKLYNGWQQKKETDMKPKDLINLLEEVKVGKTSVAEAAIIIDRDQRNEQDIVSRSQPGGGGSCVY